jgi:O-acetyl-ADP-ribose deacetylase (regulator of RNase III)
LLGESGFSVFQGEGPKGGESAVEFLMEQSRKEGLLIEEQPKETETDENCEDLGDVEGFEEFEKTLPYIPGEERQANLDDTDNVITFKKNGQVQEDMQLRYIDEPVVRGPNYSSCIRMMRGDVFESTDALGHLISADVHMGAGIAYDFKCEFGGIQELFMQRILPGGVAILERNVDCDGKENLRYVYNLVTKVRYSDKTDVQTLQRSLEAMREHALKHDVEIICLPKIGCGLDQMYWPDVYNVIHEVFAHTDIMIKVFVLPRATDQKRVHMIEHFQRNEEKFMRTAYMYREETMYDDEAATELTIVDC